VALAQPAAAVYANSMVKSFSNFKPAASLSQLQAEEPPLLKGSTLQCSRAPLQCRWNSEELQSVCEAMHDSDHVVPESNITLTAPIEEAPTAPSCDSLIETEIKFLPCSCLVYLVTI